MLAAALDIETYGALEKTRSGHRLPTQKETRNNGRFVPAREIFLDGPDMRRGDLIQTVSLTLCEDAPDADKWDLASLAAISPGETMVFWMDRPHHQRMLRQWLSKIGTLFGMNLAFDIGNLRAYDPLFSAELDHRHTLIDVSILNYLEDEQREARSLKELGRVLGIYLYDEELSRGRFTDHEMMALYNAQDTHNTILAARRLCEMMLERGESHKCSPFCIRHYSDLMWSSIFLTENGIAFDRPRLQSFLNDQLLAIRSAERAARRRYNLLLSKRSAGGRTGSQASRLNFMLDCAEEAGVLDHPNMEFTEKKGEISSKEGNRLLIHEHLGPLSPRRHAFDLIMAHAHATKLAYTYCWPLLYSKRDDSNNKTAVLCPRDPWTPDEDDPVWFDHPTWYLTPGASTKDGEGSEGGTKQGRIVCKNGPRQTDPRPIENLRTSRFRGGYLVDFDLSQIELRVAGLLSGEPFLVDNYKQGGDLHGRRARATWGDQIFELVEGIEDLRVDQWRTVPAFNLYRQVGKRINFADLFWSSAETMQTQVHEDCGFLFPIEFFERIVAQRRSLTPTLYAWQEGLIEEARSTYRLELPFTGQTRSFISDTRGSKHDVNEIINFKVQTVAGNTMLRLQSFIIRETIFDPEIAPFLNVYDSIKLDVAGDAALGRVESLIERALEWCAKEDYWAMMQDYSGYEVPLEGEISTKKPPTPGLTTGG